MFYFCLSLTTEKLLFSLAFRSVVLLMDCLVEQFWQRSSWRSNCRSRIWKDALKINSTGYNNILLHLEHFSQYALYFPWRNTVTSIMLKIQKFTFTEKLQMVVHFFLKITCKCNEAKKEVISLWYHLGLVPDPLFCARFLGVEPKRGRVQPLCRARGRESSGTGLDTTRSSRSELERVGLTLSSSVISAWTEIAKNESQFPFPSIFYSIHYFFRCISCMINSTCTKIAVAISLA